MLVLMKLITLVILVSGVIYLVKPAALYRYMTFWKQGSRVMWGMGLRCLMGLVLLAAAPQCRWPTMVVAVGILLLLSGVHGFLRGLDRMRSSVEWAEGWPPLGVRAWAVFQTALGVFLLSAAW